MSGRVALVFNLMVDTLASILLFNHEVDAREASHIEVYWVI